MKRAEEDFKYYISLSGICSIVTVLTITILSYPNLKNNLKLWKHIKANNKIKVSIVINKI